MSGSGFGMNSIKKNNHDTDSSQVPFAKDKSGSGPMSVRSSGRNTPVDLQKPTAMDSLRKPGAVHHDNVLDKGTGWHNAQQYSRSYGNPNLNKSLPIPR